MHIGVLCDPYCVECDVSKPLVTPTVASCVAQYCVR